MASSKNNLQSTNNFFRFQDYKCKHTMDCRNSICLMLLRLFVVLKKNIYYWTKRMGRNTYATVLNFKSKHRTAEGPEFCISAWVSYSHRCWSALELITACDYCILNHSYAFHTGKKKQMLVAVWSWNVAERGSVSEAVSTFNMRRIWIKP